MLSLYLRVFGMRGWEIAIRLNANPEHCEPDHRDDAGFVDVEDGYRQATIVLNGYNIKPDQLADVVAHEFAHIVLWRLAEAAECKAGRLRGVVSAIKEETTETITRALLRIWETESKR